MGKGVSSLQDQTKVRFFSYRRMGAHFTQQNNCDGITFAVWAPYAKRVCVVGDFNHWNGWNHQMKKKESTGVWELFIPQLGEYTLYKYEIQTEQLEVILKSDPYGFYAELRPDTASKAVKLDGYAWTDHNWQQKKGSQSLYDRPVSIYEVHVGSWRRKQDGREYTYRELAEELPDYCMDMGYTHIEFMPVSEYPYDGSWGYQVTGYYSVTARYGSPYDFMFLIDCCHQKGIGVILDWVPGHFPKDAHGLRRFDGTALYEHEDPRQGEQRQWGTLLFNYGREEVVDFLISNALFWLEIYHVDGLRVDAVSTMLYLDYGKKGNEWLPNRYGGNENLDAIAFMRLLHEAVYRDFPNTLMAAEEATSYPMVTQPTYLGGLGFNYKWNMGWMNDTLRYMGKDSAYRKWHHNWMTFSLVYAFSENFILPLSHDEVVHGKKSLLNRMPGDYWQKFANLRVLFGYMIAHPGKKLLFMGGEFGQFIEWKFDSGLDWHLLGVDMHGKLHHYVRELNHFYLSQRSLWEMDHVQEGFRWINPNDYGNSILSFLRYAKDVKQTIVVVCNFTPVVWNSYRIGIPENCPYVEIFNSDQVQFGGSGVRNQNPLVPEEIPWDQFPYSLHIRIPPFAVLFFKVVA